MLGIVNAMKTPHVATCNLILVTNKHLCLSMLIATQPYSPGDQVTLASPLIYALFQAMKGRLCDFCFGVTKPVRACSRCHRVWYCHADWLLHKPECQLFVKYPESRFQELDQYAQYFLRAVLLFRSRPSLAKQKHRLFNGLEVAFDDLMTHHDFVANEKKETIKEIFKDFKKLFDIECGPAEMLLFCRLQINNYGVSLPTIKDRPFQVDGIATALSIEVSKFNHSCAPSVFQRFVGNKIEMIAAKQIQVGEELTFSYVPPCLRLSERRMKLAKYNFVCDCSRCQVGEERDASGKPIDYKFINFLLSINSDVSIKNDRLEAMRWNLGEDSNMFYTLNKIFPNHILAKTKVLVTLVKLDNRFYKMSSPDMIRAAIGALKVTAPDEQVMQFDHQTDDQRAIVKMFQYLISYDKIK